MRRFLTLALWALCLALALASPAEAGSGQRLIRDKNVWPPQNALASFDFVNRRYWWGGRPHSEADFTTFTLNGSTFDVNGLTPSATIDVTLATSAIGTVVPGGIVCSLFPTAVPAAARTPVALDDGTTDEEVRILQSNSNALQLAVIDGAATQASFGTFDTGALNIVKVAAASWNTNSFLLAFNGVGLTGAGDTSGTLPTVTTLRFGKRVTGAAEQYLGAIRRCDLYSLENTRTQTLLRALSFRHLQ